MTHPHRPCTSLPCLWAVLFVGLWLPASVIGQVTFEAKTETGDVVQGSQFDVDFVLTNAQGEGFKMPALGGLQSRRGITESFGTQFINGRGSTTQSWSLHIEATQVGTFTIGPASVTANGTTLSTKPLTIRVQKPRPITGINIPPGSDGQVFLAQQFDPPQAVTGQQVTWRLLLCSRLPIEQGGDLLDLPDFAGFAHREKRHFDTRSRKQTIGGKKYQVRSLYEEALWPQESGSLTVGQSAVRVFIEPADAISAMRGPVPVVLRATPAEYIVNPLPQPAPAGFSGAVGRYQWEVKADKATLNTDDALTLSLSLSGNGQSRAISPAPLALPPGLEAFDPKIHDEPEQETTSGFTHHKVMEYAILPKQPGHYALWPEFVFYDPDSSRYRRLSPPDSLRIVVQPGANYLPPPTTSAEADSLLTQQPPQAQPGMWRQLLRYWPQVRLGFFAFLILGLLLLARWWLKPPSHPRSGTAAEKRPLHRPTAGVEREKSNRSTPLHSGETGKKQAPPPTTHLTNARQWVQQPEAEGRFYHAIYHALLDGLTEQWQIAPSHLDSVASIRQEMSRRRVAEPRIAALLSAWQTSEEVLFGGQSAPERMADTLRQAEMALAV